MKLATRCITYYNDHTQRIETTVEVWPDYPPESEESLSADFYALGLRIDPEAGTITVYDVETGSDISDPASVPDLVATLKRLYRLPRED